MIAILLIIVLGVVVICLRK